MKESNISKIIGVGAYLPPKVLTNSDLEKMVETSDEWIQTRTGIKERRIAGEGVPTSALASKAGLDAIKDAGLTVDDIDLIICATVTPDMMFPSTAAVVQNIIGARQIPCFDISAACCGFPYALTIADGMVKSGMYKNVLVLAAEVLSSFIDWSERSTCVLFGDGAGACVVTAGSDSNIGIVSTLMGADGAYTEILKVPGGGSRMPPSQETLDQKLQTVKMAGSEVFKLAVRSMADAVVEVCNRAGISVDDLDCLIPHQANMRILQAVTDRIKMDPEKVFVNLDRYGNMSAASTAVALCEAVKEGRVKKGSYAVLVAFGAGLTWAACCLKW